MGCNCGKKRPTGMKSTKKNEGPQAIVPSQRVKQTYQLITTTGRTMTFGSRLEADAARVRAGGGTVRPS